jgi:ribonuclease HII
MSYIGCVTRFCAGIDENGLGPRLGPLVVTSVLARTTESGVKVATRRPGRAYRKRLDDSKALVAFGHSEPGEAWARALARRLRRDAPTPDVLVHALSVDPAAHLRELCPPDHEGQCWDCSGERFAADPKLVLRVERDLDRLASEGVEIASVDVAVVCTKRLNVAAETGRSRFDLDLYAMERLVLVGRERAGAEVQATCGKVGGFDRYSDRFGPLSGRLHAVVAEGRAKSQYTFPGVGDLAFVRDADRSHLLVCMASLVGKWVRDLLMSRVVRYHRAVEPSLPDASGYHDPVTARFVKESALTRKKRVFQDACFERNRAMREA